MTLYIIALFIIVAVWFMGVRRKENHLIIGAALLSIILFGVYVTENIDDFKVVTSISSQDEVTTSMFIHFIDVGQGDATYIQYDDVDILIDAGPNKSAQKVVEYLKNQNVDDLELVIATHAHEDHIGGMDEVLKAFPVERVIDSGEERTTKTYGEYLLAVKEENCQYGEDNDEVIVYDQHFKIEIIDVVDQSKETNNNSVIAKVSYDDVNALFAGDAEYETEELLLHRDISSEIFKASHHGSDTSNTLPFLSTINPKYVIISAGEGNKYGHPKKGTVGNFLAYTKWVYGTWVSGDITIEVNKNGIYPEEGLSFVQ